jgi:alpha-D-ribose 1-methylphosphonate 5-triphosphate synthase subunit PhnL
VEINAISFKYYDVSIQVNLTGNITCLVGNSATGKTFILKALASYYDFNNRAVKLISHATDYKELESLEYKNTLILCDRFDIWATDTLRMKISNDVDNGNQYVICTRSAWGLGVPMRYLQEVDKSENTLKTRFKYEDEV